MSSFRGVDYLLIDSLFNEQELFVRQTARQFVDDRVLPVIRDCFRDARFPLELIGEMGRLGFFGANLEGYGCAGMSNVEYGLLMQELERGDSGLRSFASVQGALVMYPIYTYGSEEQKQRWLPRLQSGEALGCFGLTEPDFGSNPAGMRPIASHQLVQEKLANMITEITKAQLLALHCGRLKDQKRLDPAHVSMLKRNNVSIALDCARLSRDLLGANGITDEYPIMRHLCNLETVKTYEGTDHIHALVIGERVTGVAAYR